MISKTKKNDQKSRFGFGNRFGSVLIFGIYFFRFGFLEVKTEPNRTELNYTYSSPVFNPTHPSLKVLKNLSRSYQVSLKNSSYASHLTHKSLLNDETLTASLSPPPCETMKPSTNPEASSINLTQQRHLSLCVWRF